MSRRLALFLLLFAIACGRKGAPAPPVPIIPQSASDLVVTQRGTNVILAWTFPTLTTAGTKLPLLSRISVYRYVESLPAAEMGRNAPAADPGQIDPNRPIEQQLFARIALIAPPQFVKLRERIATIEEKEIPTYTAGARILFEDRPSFQTEDGRPVRINYAVTAFGPTSESAVSNIVTIIPLTPPAPPGNLSIASRAEGVQLQWQAPANAEATRPIGYNVYRFPPQGEISELGKPVNASPVADTKFVDAPAYGSHRYVVTAVRDAGPPQIESEATQTVLAEFKDLVAPAVPANLTTLRESNAVRLVWDAVEASDLAGYRVYRQMAGGERLLVTSKPIAETTYRDEVPQLGVSYSYSVSSVDKSGNESSRALAPAVMLPR